MELLVKVHLCFGLDGQLADLLERKAKQLVQNLGRKWEHICSTEGEEQLLMCLSLFLQCSRCFLRAGRFQKHLLANEFCALICLQLKAVQIHLAACLQEHQAAVRQIEGNGLDSLIGLGHPSELGLDSFMNAWPLDGTASGTNTPPVTVVNQEAVLGTPSAINEDGDLGEAAETNFFAAAGTPLEADTAVDMSERSGETFPLEGATPLSPARLGISMHGVHTESLDASHDTTTRDGNKVDRTVHPLGSAGDPFVIINLEAEEVEVFMEYHHDFVVAFQVVSAYRHVYGEHLHQAWPRALYRQVVLLGNVLYLQVLLTHMPLSKEHLEATVQLYLHESCPEQFPARAQWMKQFLRDGVPNLETRYQLARQLGTEFADISMETASLVYMA